VFRGEVHDAPLYRDPPPGSGAWIAVVTDERLDDSPCPILPMEDAEVVARVADLVERHLLG
jgi:hypothetical protein